MRIAAFLLILIAMTACTTAPEQEAEFAPWQLPEGQPREVVQILNGRYGDTSFSLQVRMSLTEEKMLIAGLDSLGRRAFDILWDENGVRSGKADWVSEDLDALDILKVIVAAYWPEDDPMQAQVADRAGQLEIIYQSGRVNAWNETVQIRDSETDYEMTIVSYELAE
ncbi:DUF3261 domain-containing protein [Sneathiella sp.]|uniref:DUF3261 domain-containing protein n=1 Tax=Sneathiella sp. TaxID=1964365 RepID=UPI0026323F54|nr:DUF3261 domain-containing protein [Sneathiella sp.]MDF2366744.1 DUF3261 domain-containing protein [Sneathiella sp.]